MPGGAVARETKTGAIDVRQKITLSAADQEHLFAEGDEPGYKRFMLAGRLIYDDFLGQRHTIPFCTKLRLFGDPHTANVFQMPMGGGIYNRLMTKPIPSKDDLAFDL